MRISSYLQIEYNLYDADGAQIGTALANINNLKAGGTWKFEAAEHGEARGRCQLGARGRFWLLRSGFVLTELFMKGGGDGARTSDGRAFA